jgi:chromate transporter
VISAEAVAIANRVAPEHLELALADPDPWVAQIHHAGAIFIGHYTSESLGDYCAGPNHVLPTSGSARFSSPLGVYDFQKRDQPDQGVQGRRAGRWAGSRRRWRTAKACRRTPDRPSSAWKTDPETTLTAAGSENPNRPDLRALFLGFSAVGLSGFGGVLPFARRMLVEEKRWMTGEEFNTQLGLCQFLPGPNVINLAVVVGKRYQGVAGAVVAPFGLLAGPFVIVLLLALLYDRYGNLPIAQAMLRGIAAAGCGLLFAMGLAHGNGDQGQAVFSCRLRC